MWTGAPDDAAAARQGRQVAAPGSGSPWASCGLAASAARGPQRPCAEGFSRVLLSVDQFRVVSADLTHGAVSGGVCTVVACALLGVLLFAELGASLRVSYSTNVVIDDELDESLRIEYDTSVFDLPCKYREVGSWDKCGKDRFVTNKSFTHSTLVHWGGTAGAKHTEAEIAVLEQADVASDIAEDEAKELDSDWSASSDHSQHKDFQAAATFHDYTLVNFYAEWRSHCRQFLPTWIEASDKIGEKMHVSDGDGRQSTVKFLKTNCVDFQDNCKKAKIAAFPTLRSYKRHGSFEVFQQHRSVTNIVSFLTSSIRNSHLIVARHHMMFNEGCRVAGQIHVPRAQGSLHLQAEPFGKKDLNPAITNVSHRACDYYSSGSCTTDCVQPAGTVALACECMSYPDSGEHNMFSVTPWSAAGYVKEAALLHTRDPAEIPSKECGADYLCKLTGVFLTDGKVQLRLKEGAKDVVPSAPATDDSHTIVMSANQDTYRTDMNLVSCATCTANGLAPKVKAAVIDAFGIPRGFMTTIHAMTASQPTVDGASQKDCSGGSAEVEEVGGEVEEEVADEIKDEDPETELKLENASHGAEHLAYQMKHGAIHGRYDGTVDVDGDCLAIKGKQVALSHTRDPAEIPFKKYGADYVCEFISMFLTDGKIQLHLKVGAKNVRSSARAADNSHTMEMGANKDTYKTDRNCVSCATCTTNALAPKVKAVVIDAFGIQRGFVTTIHAMAASQPTADGASKKDCRGGRAEETRIATEDPEAELKLKNTSLDAEYLAFQMKHGSIHGKYDGTAEVDGDSLVIDGKQVALSHTRDPAEIPFKKYGADYVCESSGVFLTDRKIQLHPKADANKVVFSALDTDDSYTVLEGANQDAYKTDMNDVFCDSKAGIMLDPTFIWSGTNPGLAVVVGDALWLLALMALITVEVLMRARAAVDACLARGWAAAARIDARQFRSRIRMYGRAAAYLGLSLAVAASVGAMAAGLVHAQACAAAPVPSAAPAAWAISWSALEFDATLGYPGEGPPAAGPQNMDVDQGARRGLNWVLTLQGNGRRAHCHTCKEEFALGEPRLQTQGASRLCHWHCVGKRWRPMATLEGSRTTPQAEVDRVRELLGEASMQQDGEDIFQAEGAQVGPVGPGPALRDPEDPLGASQLLHMAWWDTVDVPNSLGHKVATMRRVPAGLQAAWAEATGKALRESVGGQTAQDRERAWKLVIFAPRLIFAATGARGGRGANGKRAKHIKNDVAERLHAFWRGEWQELWEAAHRRELRVGAATAVDVTSRVRRVNTLLEDGQVAGAVATLRRSGQTAAGPGVHDRLRALFPEADTWDAAQDDATATPLAAETRQQLGDAIAAAFRKAKGGRAPGLDSSRNEHWRVLAADTEAVDALVEAALAWVEGSAPPVVDEWLRTGAITALHKASGGVRPLTVLAPFRRIVLTGFVAHTKAATRAAAGSYQYGLGVPGGADVQFKALQAAVHDRPGSVLVAVDVSNAFGTLARRGVIASLRGALPEYGSLLARLYARPAVGLWRDGTGDTRELRTGAGVPQGCPLSPAAFAAALHQLALQHFSARPQWLVTAYLDDVVAVVPSAEAEEYLRQLSGLLGPGGLVLDPSKTKVWLPPGTARCPPSLRQYVKDELQVVGCSLTRRQDDDWDALAAGAGGGVRAMGAATETLRAFGQTLWEARAAGLGPQEATAMLRWTAQGLPNHLLRAHLQDLVAVRAYDTVLRGLWNDVLGVDMSDREWVQSCLPLRDGGLAAGAAEPRREAAHIAAWLDAAPRVAAALGAPSAEALLAARAAGTQGFEAAVVTYNASVGAAHCLQTSLAQGERHRQKDLVGPRMEVIAGVAKAGLDHRERGRLLSAGGPGAGAFTMLPTKPEHRMAPELYRISLGRRLLMTGARLLRGLEPQTHCRNTSREGVLCGAVLDTDQHHALACETGGRRVARHDRIRDLLARWLARRVPAWVQKEQTVPQWQRTRRAVVDGVETARVETAVLDVVWARQGCARAVDVVVVSPDSTDEREARARAAKAGLAAEDAARDKARRCPPGPTTPLLIPFAIETGGRVGSSARQLIQDHLDRSDGEAGASADAVAFWQELSAVLQTAVAEQLLSAHKPPVVGGGR
ncbi:unnamed protein product [Prorocentrum cordatum]|uniref:Uncharacterized protein n=1 Tax=Prorocentrum cordatum TaxID=2364126 RepID=A0ABN9TKJ5_9DINO|nr:unnamed protein product [Polarella glacialis]